MVLLRIVTTGVLLVALLVLVVTGRDARLAGLELADDNRIVGGSALTDDAPIERGDIVLGVDGIATASLDGLRAALRNSGESAVVRVLKQGSVTEVELSRSFLRGELPDEFRQPFRVVAVEGAPTFQSPTVAMLRAQLEDAGGTLHVDVVSPDDVFDGTVPVDVRGPPLTAWLCVLAALLALAAMWSFAPVAVGLVGVAALGGAWALTGTSLSLQTLYVAGLALLALALAAGLIVGGVELRRRLVTHSGSTRSAAAAQGRLESLLRQAAADAEPLDVAFAVGVSGTAVLFDVTEGSLRSLDCESLLASSLSMLAWEGGRYPRHLSVQGHDDPAEDPLADLDRSVGLAAAIPCAAFAQTQDQWAYLVAFADEDAPIAATEPVVAALLETLSTYDDEALYDELHRLLNAALARSLREHRIVAQTMQREARLQEEAQKTERPQVRGPAERSAAASSTPPPLPMKATGEGEGVSEARVVRDVSMPEESARQEQGATKRTDDQKTPAGVQALVHFYERQRFDEYPVDDPSTLTDADWELFSPLLNVDRPLLIVGEAGVGKTFVARALHAASTRAAAPVVELDCARLAAAAIEIELFGSGEAEGILPALSGGTLILKSATRLGRATLDDVLAHIETLDVRLSLTERYQGAERELPHVIASRLRDVVGERFVHLRPLRERPADTLRYARYFTHLEAMTYGVGARELDERAELLIEELDLPGNVHDLRSIIRAAVLRSDDVLVDVRAILGVGAGDVPRELAREEADLERRRLIDVLQQTEGNKSEAARVLNISRSALVRRLTRHGLL